jgi:hypothetical protein
MPELIIYQITNEEIKDVATTLVKGLFDKNVKAVLVFDSHSLMNDCDKKIWTFASEQFIPHGMITDKFDKELQSFYLTDRFEVIAGFLATAFIFENDNTIENITKITSNDFPDYMERVIYMFSGILESQEYVKEIGKLNLDSKFTSHKFFCRQNATWLKII